MQKGPSRRTGPGCGGVSWKKAVRLPLRACLAPARQAVEMVHVVVEVQRHVEQATRANGPGQPHRRGACIGSHRFRCASRIASESACE